LFDGNYVSADTDISFKPTEFADHVKSVSISGAQEKLFAVAENGRLRLSYDWEQSTFIIKPAPVNEVLNYRDEMPVNEYLTMQIANSVFGIEIAPCAIIRLRENRPAYIVKRFDILNDNRDNTIKLQQEDLCSLMGKTSLKNGPSFKYEGSYLEMANSLKQVLPTWRFEIQKFLRIIVFNYLFSNGDAHSKNFSVIRKTDGTLALSPAYDLLCTSLHIQDTPFAMSEGLGISAHSDYCEKTGHATAKDFFIFGKECGLTDRQIEKIIQPFLQNHSEIETFVSKSMLSKKCQRIYLREYQTRLNYLKKE